MAKNVGITVNIVSLDYGAFVQKLVAHDFQAILRGDASAGGPDPDIYLHDSFITKGIRNWGLYSNPDVDKLLDQGRSQTDQAMRVQTYQAAQKLMSEDGAMGFINSPYQPSYVAMAKKVQGFQSPDAALYFNKAWIQK
jgi:peptide/nickel transport system substrate-binding protein